MKKNLFILAAAAAVTFGFSSCSNADCIECTVMGISSGKICEEDFDSSANGGVSWETYRDNMLLNPSCKKAK